MKYIASALAIAFLVGGTWTISKTTRAADPQTQGPAKPKPSQPKPGTNGPGPCPSNWC